LSLNDDQEYLYLNPEALTDLRVSEAGTPDAKHCHEVMVAIQAVCPTPS
jgi:hypothetical protein